MLNLASRTMLVVSAVAGLLAGGYAVAEGDRTGVVVLAFLAVAAFVAGVMTSGPAVPRIVGTRPAQVSSDAACCVTVPPCRESVTAP